MQVGACELWNYGVDNVAVKRCISLYDVHYIHHTEHTSRRARHARPTVRALPVCSGQYWPLMYRRAATSAT